MRNRAIQGGASIIALAMAGSALAQSAPTAPVTPSAPPLTPECAGVAANCSLIDQDGTDLEVSVTQDGSGNVSDVDQDNVQGGTNATATIDQDTIGWQVRHHDPGFRRRQRHELCRCRPDR